jgi:hypothetical protein
LFFVTLSGCGLFFGKRKPMTYVTPEGYKGALAQKGPYLLDAVYVDDSTRGIEGVVRLTWWNVFSVTVQNRSRSDVSIPASSFTLVDGGAEHKALSLDEVLAYESHVVGPLMSYQRRAIRRAFWSGEQIAPGAFAVGYVFFPRKSDLQSCRLILDPNPKKRKDELVAVFDLGPPPAAVPVPEATGAAADASTLAPAPTDTTRAVADTALVIPPPTEQHGEGSSPAPDTTGQTVPEAAPTSQETASPAENRADQGQPAGQRDAGEAVPEDAPNAQDAPANPTN